MRRSPTQTKLYVYFYYILVILDFLTERNGRFHFLDQLAELIVYNWPKAVCSVLSVYVRVNPGSTYNSLINSLMYANK